MKAASQKAVTAMDVNADYALSVLRRVSGRTHLGVVIWTVALVAVNWTVLLGVVPRAFIFHPELVRAGDWWRWMTHPWVHVSWYHLLLDGFAFLLLWKNLFEMSTRWKLACVFGAAAGSLAAALYAAAPLVNAHGFCGLSGVAHGLMAVWSLELIRSACSASLLRLAGIIALASLLLKSGVEAATGSAALTPLHFGLLGTPVVVCHAGGVIGAIVVYSMRMAVRRGKVQNQF